MQLAEQARDTFKQQNLEMREVNKEMKVAMKVIE